MSTNALNTHAAQVLGLDHVEVETTPVRHADRNILDASIEHGIPLQGYVVDEAGFLLPATLTQYTTTDVFAAIPNPRKTGSDHVADKTTQVGQWVRFTGHTDFGGSVAWNCYTTAAAEHAARTLGTHFNCKPFYLATDTDTGYTATGYAMPLMPVYGAQATVSVVVAGTDPTDLAARIESVLEAEFGKDLGKNRKVKTRAVENRRVDVVDPHDNTPLAIGILAAEVPLVMNLKGAVQTRPHQHAGELLIGS